MAAKKVIFMRFINAIWVIDCSMWGVQCGAVSAGKRTSKINADYAFNSGIN
jgi:hypothetical protein